MFILVQMGAIGARGAIVWKLLQKLEVVIFFNLIESEFLAS